MQYLRVWEKQYGSKAKDEYMGVLIGVVSDSEFGTDLVVVAPSGIVLHVSLTKARVEYPMKEVGAAEEPVWGGG